MNRREVREMTMMMRRVADRIDADLLAALTIAHDWRGSLKAATYDPTGRSGWRHETIIEDGTETVVALPQDPTGEAVVNQSPDQHRHVQLLAAIGNVMSSTPRLEDLMDRTVPKTRRPPIDDDDPLDGWCESCYRIGAFTPEDMHRDGRVRHKGLCQWCASFKADKGELPPLVLLRKRRDGKRISESDIIKAMGRAS